MKKYQLKKYSWGNTPYQIVFSPQNILEGEETLGKLQGQIMRFGLVGITATATHIIAILIMVEWSNIEPLTANFFAFSMALLISFTGNYHWTFNASDPYTESFPRFFTIALFGMGLNQTIMFIAVSMLNMDYRLGLVAVIMVVPAISFMANRKWAFQSIKN